MWRWLALAAYTSLLYGLLPYGPALGRAVQATALGRIALGQGAGIIVGIAAIALAVRMRRRRAPGSAWVLAAVTVLGYAAALGWLRAIRLERVHLPEYGIASWLAWRALAPSLGDRAMTYVAATLLAAAIGWGDELLQAVTPGRVYDLRDVAANAVGGSLGVALLATWRAGEPAASPPPTE